MAKDNSRVKPRLPRGFEDRGPADIAAMNKMIDTIRGVYELYGFDPVETPMFEYTEALGKFLPDEDRPNQGVFSLQDDDESWMSLRYDLTAPLARHFAENYQDLPKPYRTYRQGYVFRNEKPGPGRFRQFMQFDADTVGAPGPEADAEMCMMMADTMDALGLEDNYIVRVSNRKLLDGILELVGVSDGSQRLTVLRAIDKLDKIDIEGVKALIGAGRTDASGDFTKGAGLNVEQISKIVRFLQIWSIEESLDSFDLSNPSTAASLREILKNPPQPISTVTERQRDFYFLDEDRDEPLYYADLNESTVDFLDREIKDIGGYNTLLHEAYFELRQMVSLFTSSGYGKRRIKIDPSVVRGLEYYTGPVFEIELTFPVTNEKGQEVVFGSVGGGGRYDGLVSRFRPEATPATGFSMGVSRLMTALRLTGNLGDTEVQGPVVVLVMDRDQIAGYQQIVSDLRRAGIRAEMFLGQSKNFGKQVNYADKRNAPAVIIEGTQEREQGIVQIKDLIEGKRAAAAIKDNAEWKSERPGQFEVKREEVVSAIQKLLADQQK